MIERRRSISVQLFGDVLVTHTGGARIDVPRRVHPLLAYLVLHRGKPASRAALAQALFPDHAAPQNRARLRANLHALLQALPRETAQWLSLDGECVALHPAAPLWADATEFERLAGDSEQLAAAAALYAGDLAPALPDEWIVPIREHYRRRHAAVLEALLTHCRRARDFAGALGYAQRLLEIDPWREDIVRRIMAIRHEAGDRSGALAVFDHFSERLHRELGTEPMPETRLARDVIVRHEAPGGEKPKHHHESIVRSREPRNALPFVGREEEFAALLGHWNRTASGNGGLVLIAGDAGIGKSRLAEELARHVEEHGGRVLRGGSTFPETTPYQCFVEALRSAGPLLASLELTPVWQAALAELLPELRGVPDRAPPRLDADREQQRLFESIVRAVLALARPRPLLLVLEDLHWADEATVAALLFLARRTLLAPVLIAATYRDGELGAAHPIRSLRHELRAQGLLVEVAPRPLQLADIARLAGNECASALLERSDGNPLLLLHLIAAHPGSDAAAEPDILASLVGTQLAQLGDNARIVAEIAAIAGAQFSSEVIEEVTGWNAPAVAHAIDALVMHRIVREPVCLGGLEFEFSHQLVREAVIASVPARRARQRHRRIAIVLERLYRDHLPESAAIIAPHYESGGDDAAAARYYLQAARYAARVGAYDSAFAHFERGLACAQDPSLRADLLLGREALLHVRGDRAAQQADLEALQALMRAIDDAELRREVTYRRLIRATAMGLVDEQRALLDDLRTCTGSGAPVSWKRRVLLAQADQYKLAGSYDDAFRAVSDALQTSRDDDDGSERAQALCVLANLEVWRGRFAQAMELLRQAAAVAASPTSKRRVLEERANYAIERDDYVELQSICSELSALCQTMGDRKGEAAALTWIGIALTRSDRYAVALEALDQAFVIAQEIDDRGRSATVLANRAHLYMVMGALHEAAALLERARELHEKQRAQGATIANISNLSAIYAYLGDATRALELAQQAADLSRGGRSPLRFAEALENVAEAHACAENYTAAIEAMEASISERRHIDSSVTVAWCLANLALWYAALNDLASARERIAAMLADEKSIRTGNPWPQFCYWAASRVAGLCGDAAEAWAMIANAYSLLQAQAENCPTTELRASFLALAWNREITAAYNEMVGARSPHPG